MPGVKDTPEPVVRKQSATYSFAAVVEIVEDGFVAVPVFAVFWSMGVLWLTPKKDARPCVMELEVPIVVVTLIVCPVVLPSTL